MDRMVVILRDLLLSDLVELEKKALFDVSFFSNKPKIVQKTFEDEKGLIGSVIVNGTVELSMILNERSARDKIEVMRQLPDILYKELYVRGYRDIHAFVKDRKFADLLIKHFGFEDVVGHALVRRY